MTTKQSLLNHYEHRLGVPPTTLTDGVAHLIVSPAREELDELGIMRPFWAFDTEDSFLVSIAPRVADDMPLALSNFTFESLIEDEFRTELRSRIARRVPLAGFEVESELFCTPDLLKPVEVLEARAVTFEEIDPAPELRPVLKRTLALPLRDGDVFGVFRNGRIMSCAWLKRFSVYAWNVCVLSPGSRGRTEWEAQALAVVVRRALECGKIAVMNVSPGNVRALRLAQLLGFRVFGRSLVAVSKRIRRR